MDGSSGRTRRETRAALMGGGISIGAHLILALTVVVGFGARSIEALNVGAGVTTTLEVGLAEEPAAPAALADSRAITVATAARGSTSSRARPVTASARRRAAGLPVAQLQPSPAVDPPVVAATEVGTAPEQAHDADDKAATRALAPAQATPIFVPGEVAQYLREQDFFPSLPTALREDGMRHHARLDICVSTEGRVVDVGMRDATTPALHVLQTAARGWRYHPLIVDGMPKPFCHRIMVSYEVM